MFRVNISYIEHELTRDEVRELCYKRFGGESSVNVEFLPIDNSEEAALDFVLDGLITEQQSDLLFGDTYLYPARKARLREEVLKTLIEHMDKVLEYNEKRL